MRISNIQPYAVNNNALKTHPEKFTSKPANYNAADSVSFTGRASTRAAGFILGAITALTAVFGLSTTKAEALTLVPDKRPEPPTATSGGSVNNDEHSYPPTPVEYYANEAKAARDKANEADEKAKQLETAAKRAQSAAYIAKETKSERYAVRSANETAGYINNYIDMTNSSINNVEKLMTKVEEAIETGKLSGEDAELAQALLDETRNGIANVQAASEEAGASGSALRDSASRTSKLIKNAIDAAKDGVNLGNMPQIKKSGEDTKEATNAANDKAKDLRTTFESMMKSANKLQAVASGVVNPAPLMVPMKQLPIYDTVEDLTGRTPEEIEASSLKGQAQMARMTANNLIKEAERLEQKAEAYAIIQKARAAEIRAEEANKNLEALKEEMEAANAAAKDSRDAVPARTAGRNALQNDVYSAESAVVSLKYSAEKAEKVLALAESEGVEDETLIAALEKAIADIDVVIEDVEGKKDTTSDAARDALNSKNKEEANAALKKLNKAKTALKGAVGTANAKTGAIKAAIKDLYAAIEELTGKKPLMALSPDTPPMPPKVVACGSLEIYGQTEEEIAAKRAEADYAEAKRQAQVAQANYEALQKDAERAKAMLILLQSEEMES